MERSLVDLNLVVKEFLERRWDGKSPLLIAYSGGPDSRALLHGVLSWGKAEVHLAHVDHGWREESRQEAFDLEREAKELGVPFHTTRLEKKTGEEEARRLRLAFFASLLEKNSYQAVLMGHQANDLAETALKRLFEGAHLTRLFGMQAEGRVEGVLIWRPLLDVPKSAIVGYLAKKAVGSLLDPSNSDPHYLRARMRLSLLPRLEEAFGKGVFENLCLLAERSLELDRYLAKRIAGIRVERGAFGVWIDGNGCERIELRYLLQQEDVRLSRDVLETLLDWILEKKCGKKIFVGKRKIVADRGHLFLLAKELPRFQAPIALPDQGWARSGDWKIFVGAEADADSGWQSLWRTGSASAPLLGEGPFQLSLPPTGVEWKEKSPPFLRKICPCVLNQNGIAGNFLTPRKMGNGKIVKIFIDTKAF